MSFEHYLDHNRPNPRRAKLLALCAGLALTGTTMMLASVWVAGKMTIARVDPPTTEYILLQFSAIDPPPPPPPPPPPLGSDSDDDDDDDDDDDPPEEPEVLDEPPPERPNKIPSAKSVGIPEGSPLGVPGGVKNGIPGAPPGNIIGLPTGPIATKPAKQEAVANKPLSVVMARAVYTPDPDPKLLQATKSARFDKRNGRNVTSFCIGANGKVNSVKTKTKFPGDPQVDAIIRQTVESWRFKPLEVGSKTMKTCTERIFSIQFQ